MSLQEGKNEVYYALMSGKGVRIAHNNFDTGVIQLYKNLDLPYEMKYDPEVPFNTLFMSQSRHFAMIGIDKSLAGKSSGLGGSMGYIVETNDAKRRNPIMSNESIVIPVTYLGSDTTFGFVAATQIDHTYILQDAETT